MSTRYVWGRFNFSPEYKLSDDYCPVGSYEEGGTLVNNGQMSSTTTFFYMASSLTMSYSDSRGAVARINDEDYDLVNYQYGNITVPAGMYFKAPLNSAYEKGEYSDPIYYAETSCNIRGQVYENQWGNEYKGLFIRSGKVKEVIPYTQKGSKVSDVSGTSQSTYPDDGVQGSYWYTYQGQDNIDPTAVTYPGGPKSGVPITITVTPRANTYGGTISYQYEYSLDGGNVWNQLALTTAASRQYTIPKGTQTFRVRVQARDNMGFTSSDWIYGPQVNVVNNSAPSAPPTITVPVSPRGGAQTTITWTASSDVDGNLAGYELERQLDGGSWTSLYTGEGLSYLDTIPKGTATAAYRVRAYDADGEYSGYTTSATRTVVNNNPPVITSSLSGDLGTKSAGFTVPYTVTDEEGGTVTVAEQVGNLVKRTHTPTLGQEQTFHVEDQDGDYFFTQILNGPQTVRITATDEGGLSSTLELSFTKAVHSMSVTLETPLEVEEAITVAIMSVLCGIPADASYQLLATNNAKDAEPVWQDVTADVAAGRNIIFTNQVQANGPAFNFKLSASRSEGGQGGYVKSLKGAFQ